MGIDGLTDKIPVIKKLMFEDVADVQPMLRTCLADVVSSFTLLKTLREPLSKVS